MLNHHVCLFVNTQAMAVRSKLGLTQLSFMKIKNPILKEIIYFQNMLNKNAQLNPISSVVRF